MTGPLSTILGLGLFGVFCLAFTEKILPVPPSHVLLLFLGMTAAPDMRELAILPLVTDARFHHSGRLFWYADGPPARTGSHRRAGRTFRQICLPAPRDLPQAGGGLSPQPCPGVAAGAIHTDRAQLSAALAQARCGWLPCHSLPRRLLGAMLWNAGFLSPAT